MDGSQEDQHLESSTKDTVEKSSKSLVPSKRVRPTSLIGRNTRIQTGHSYMYVTINYDPDDSSKIFEVFAQVAKPDGDSEDGLDQQCERVWVEALCRMISTALRYGIPQEEVIDQLKNLECVKARDSKLGIWIKSPADGIARVMEGFDGSEDR